MHEAVIVGAVRSPIGRKNGKLSGIHPTDLLGMVLRGLLERAGVDPLAIDDVIGGCVTQTGEQGVNVTRNAWIAAGLPWDVPAVTVDSQCGSSQQALHSAAAAVSSGQLDLAIAGGVEAMSRVALGANGLQPGFPFSQNWIDVVGGPEYIYTQFQAAQEIARKWGITRQEMDELALQSHQRAALATDEGRFEREIVPIKVTQDDGSVEEITEDGCIRRDTTLEKLASLQPVREDCPDITAGNSSPYSDGASAVLIASAEKAEELGLKKRARFHEFAIAGCEPIVMLKGPVPVTRLNELERTGKRFGFQTMCEGGGQAHATIIERLD